MHVLLTGSTGYIGSAVLEALANSDHQVTTLVRSQAAADRAAVSSRTVIGTMRDHALVRELAGGVDAVLHTATPGDETSSAAENEFADAVLDGLDGRDAVFIRTGGIWVHGSGTDITEETPHRAPQLVAWRTEIDERVLRAPNVRSVLIEPAIVYGKGGGIPNLITKADLRGTPAGLQLIGDGQQHWGTVHVDDLADLYLLALHDAPHGTTYLGASGHNPTVHELGEAASRRRGYEGNVSPETAEDTVARLGAFGEALLLDQQAFGSRARTELGWSPRRQSLLSEIEDGSYTDD